MADVNIAAPPSAAPAAAPVSTQTSQGSHNPSEAAINPSPTHIPTPVGPQAPDAPARDAPPSRREAIQQAFDRANKPPAKPAKPAERPAPPAAEAKAGHNQPPEETPKLNLKKRPDDQAPPQAQPRGERGQFAPRQAAQTSDISAENPPQTRGIPAEGPRPAQLPEGTPYRDPPQRFSERAKADWAAAPEAVRADVHRMHSEFDNAYKRLKSDADAMAPIRQYHEMARQHGTTLDKALANYTSMERKLREDPVGGLDVIVNNLGLTSPDGQRIGLRDIAYHVLSQSPDQLRVMQQGNQQQAAAQQIGALHQEVKGLKDHLQQMHTAQQFSYTRSQVDQFAEAHPRFDELGTQIEQELRLGFDLESAYRRAELLRPAPHADQTRTTSAQTRQPDRSISGAPDVAPSNGASRQRSSKPVNGRDAIQDAIRRVSGSF